MACQKHLVLSGIVKPKHDVLSSALSIWHNDALNCGSNWQNMDLEVVLVD